MSLEREAMRGRQAERKLRLMGLTTEIAALSGGMRAYLASDIPSSLQEVDRCWSLMTRWHELQSERQALQAQYDAAQKELA